MSQISWPAESLYSCTVMHCSYLVLVLYYEVSGVHFWGLHVLTIDSMRRLSECTPD